MRTKKAWHSRLCRRLTVSALLRATHCVPRICSTREAIWWLAEVKIWRGRHGSCVEVWPLEVNMHAWIRFCTTQCGRDRCALDSHWIRIGQFGYWTSLNPDSVWTGLYCVFSIHRVKALCVVPGAELVFSTSSDGTVIAWKMNGLDVSLHDNFTVHTLLDQLCLWNVWNCYTKIYFTV